MHNDGLGLNAEVGLSHEWSSNLSLIWTFKIVKQPVYT
jgi:hypothetical protein